MAPSELQQLPSRVSPLSEVLARIDAVAGPVTPHTIEVSAAAGRVLAAEVAVDQSLPPVAITLRDGWAVRAEMVADASPYAPVPLSPAPTFVEIGTPLPGDADAVLPPDAVTIRGGIAEATASAVSGEGAFAAAADAAAGQILRCAGERLRAIDVAALRAAGVSRVGVRVPRLVIITANVFIDAVGDTVAPLVARDIATGGGSADIVRCASDGTPTLEHALEQSQHADAVVIVGGSGAGGHDASVRTLARLGAVHVHGIGITPGESAGLGSLGARPVLILPGRLDAALAAWLVLGRHLVLRLTGCTSTAPGTPARLTRKIASAVGLAQVVLVRRTQDGVEPIAAECFPLHTLGEADGWVLIPPEREGFPPGATVDMHALP